MTAFVSALIVVLVCLMVIWVAPVQAADSVAGATVFNTNSKAAMPAFKGRLTPEEIANVAAYVLNQSEKGW